jgi:PAS domain S-box-containing protein
VIICLFVIPTLINIFDGAKVMRKTQIDEISNLLLSYSAGEYHVKGAISEKADEVDMIILGINMLGEELVSSNVSMEYFSSIFNAVTDLIFVLNSDGIIENANNAVIELLKFDENELIGQALKIVFNEEHESVFDLISDGLKNQNQLNFESQLRTKKNELVFGMLSCSCIINKFGDFKGYLISIKDITKQKENEKLILKTIINTQESEQSRVANDLHDSLGQELSMAQLMISNFKRFDVPDQEFYNLVELCSEILDGSIHRLREICFDLMPNVLVKGGVELAIDTLVKKLVALDEISIEYFCTEDFPRLDAELETVIYRILQEFVNNMTKHSNATQLKIYLLEKEDSINFNLIENGQGFDIDILEAINESRGLSNIKTKVLAFSGDYKLTTEIGKGTELWIVFPKKTK